MGGGGESGAAERGGRVRGAGQCSCPAPSNTMLQGLLTSQPGLGWCCAPHGDIGISMEVLGATTLPGASCQGDAETALQAPGTEGAVTVSSSSR